MSPDTVKKLLEDVPEARELIAYIDKCANELNQISDLDAALNTATVNDLGIEVLARKRAFEKLLKILDPFVNAQVGLVPGVKSSEYDVDVDTPPKK